MNALEKRIQDLETEVHNLRQRLDRTHSRLYDQIVAGVDGVVQILVTQHHELGGLQDDDHRQYVAVGVARTISTAHTFNPDVAGPPFVLGENAQGQTVAGLKATYLAAVVADWPPEPLPGLFWIRPLEE